MKDFVSKFKSRRQEKGLSLKEAAEKTNIRSKYLEAIEEGDFEELQGEVFLKGFIKIYSSFLGLNTDQILEDYEKYKASITTEEEVEEEPTLYEQLGKYIDNKQDNIVNTTLIVIVVLVLLILGYAGFFIYNNFVASDNPILTEENLVFDDQLADNVEDIEQSIEQNIEQQQELEITDAEEDNFDHDAIDDLATEEENTEQVEEQEQVEIEIVTIAETWYSVIIDGEDQFRGMTEEGDRNSFRGREIEVTIGNAAGIEITKDGEVSGPFGESGDVIYKQFIAE